MSEDRRSPPPDWRHGGPLPEEPPHLHGRNLRDDPEVQALLRELSAGLKPGEDPLFYELPQAPPDDPEACAPNAATRPPPRCCPEWREAIRADYGRERRRGGDRTSSPSEATRAKTPEHSRSP